MYDILLDSHSCAIRNVILIPKRRAFASRVLVTHAVSQALSSEQPASSHVHSPNVLEVLWSVIVCHLDRCSLPLLKSRNSGVVLAVCTTHYYCGSRAAGTMNQVAKAMVRILRNRREIQFVVLDAIRSVFVLDVGILSQNMLLAFTCE